MKGKAKTAEVAHERNVEKVADLQAAFGGA
jgi:hypothetical protein